jgi:MFS family permease
MSNSNDKRLFWASFLTLIAAGVGFSIRGAILGEWGKQFGFTQSELGGITGGGLIGFGLTIIGLSFFADLVGYGPLMVLAFLLHVSSAALTLAATPIFNAYGKDATYLCLYWGMFLFALGNGTCEAVINPLTATLFPNNKTHWLNILHAGWPGGLILGAVLGLIFNWIGNVRWEIQMSAFLIPTVLYGALMFGRTFPHSEAKVAGATLGDMLKELGLLGAGVVVAFLGLWLSSILSSLGLPGAIGWGIAVVLLIAFGSVSQFQIGHWMLAMLLILHAMVGYVELGTDSWISNITGNILDNKNYGLMLFVWTSGLMFVLRFFAGPIVHKISPLGLLFCSAVLASVGLVLLGNAFGAVACIVAATVYGFGKTFFWPTMLGVVSERFPRGGAITLGTIGGVGMLSAGLLGGPGIGYKQDYFATRKLEEMDPAAYKRYKSDDVNRFLFFPPISGLDGSKVAALQDNGAQLRDDIAALEKSGRKLSDDKNLESLNAWWQSAKVYADADKVPIKDAGLYGGRMALIWTAAVPATMALGYLFLILYFRTQGGYQQVHIGGEEEKKKELAAKYLDGAAPASAADGSEAIQEPSPIKPPSP